MKFLVDMPLSPAIARWLGANSHDAVHAADLGLHSATDDQIVARAAQEGRVVVTADLDYPRLLAVSNAVGPGLILFRSGSWTESEIRGRLHALLTELSETEIAQSIVVIERDRVRRRSLPIG